MGKKYVILREVDTDPQKYIEGFSDRHKDFVDYTCAFNELERIAVAEKISGAVIVLLDSWRDEIQLKIVREKFPGVKIVLSCVNIEADKVRKLQHEKGLVDLYFSPVFSIEKMESMVESLLRENTQVTHIDKEETVLGDDITSAGLELDFSSQSAPEAIESNETPEESDVAPEKIEAKGEVEEKVLEADTPEEGVGNTTFVRKLSSIASEDAQRGDKSEVIDLAKEFEGADEIMGVTQVGSSDEDVSLTLEEDEASVQEKNEDVLSLETLEPEQELDEVDEKTRTSIVDFTSVVHRKDDEILRLLAHNEMQDEENRMLRERVLDLEDIASRAKLLSKKGTLEADELKIKLKVIKKRQREDFDTLKMKISLLEEKLHVEQEQYRKLKEENSQENRNQVIDMKKVREKEEELSEKIEFMKKDYSAQLNIREKRVSELKRKVDLLDFDLKESTSREEFFQNKINSLEERIVKMKKMLGNSLDELDNYSDDRLQLLKKA